MLMRNTRVDVERTLNLALTEIDRHFLNLPLEPYFTQYPPFDDKFSPGIWRSPDHIIGSELFLQILIEKNLSALIIFKIQLIIF